MPHIRMSQGVFRIARDGRFVVTPPAVMPAAAARAVTRGDLPVVLSRSPIRAACASLPRIRNEGSCDWSPAVRGTALFIVQPSMVRPPRVFKFGFSVNGRVVTVKWQQFPVRYCERPRLDRCHGVRRRGRTRLGTWGVPSAAIRHQFAGSRQPSPARTTDGRRSFFSVQGPEFDRVLASTSLLIDDLTGELSKPTSSSTRVRVVDVGRGEPGRRCRNHRSS
jgi:hypothetical protein